MARPIVITGSASGDFAIVATAGAAWYLTATAARTLTVSGGYDGMMLVVDVLASGAAQTITLSGLALTTNMTASWSIASGKVGTLGLRRTNGIWRVLAQTADV